MYKKKRKKDRKEFETEIGLTGASVHDTTLSPSDHLFSIPGNPCSSQKE